MIENKNIKKACFTGYRPQKFPFKLNNDNVDFELLKSRIFKTLTALLEDDCKIFYSGMAQGFDIICAECVLELKRNHPEIKLICALPFKNQVQSFSEEWRNRYYDILEAANDVVSVSTDYHIGCFQKRNQYMVDNSDFVVCWYDGKAGGTRNTLKYAHKNLRTIINLNVDYFDEFNDMQLNMNI